jgi:hypothetical protein
MCEKYTYILERGAVVNNSAKAAQCFCRSSAVTDIAVLIPFVVEFFQ